MEIPGLSSLTDASSAMLDKSSSMAGKAVSAVAGWKTLFDTISPPAAPSPAAPAPVSTPAPAASAPEKSLVSTGLTWSVRLVAGIGALLVLAYLALRRRK